MANNLFIQDIIIRRQSVRGLHYTTKFGEDIDFSSIDENEYSIDYDVLTHRTNKRDHILILEMKIIENNNPNQGQEKSLLRNEFHIVVEGHYEVSDFVEEKMIMEVVHFVGLSNLIGFLRTSVHGITSLCAAGPFHVPPISIETLHNQFQKRHKKNNSLETKVKSKKRKK